MLRKTANLSEETVLHTAIRLNQEKKAVTLIAEDKFLYTPDANLTTPLHLACAHRNTKYLKAMIQQQDEKIQKSNWFQRFFFNPILNWSLKDVNGRSPLHYSVVSHLENLRILLQQKLSPQVLNSQDQWGLTALHYAVAARNVDMVQALLEVKVNPEVSAYPREIKNIIPDQKLPLPTRLTPLWLALELRFFEAVALLVPSKKTLLETKTSDGLNAIHLAALMGRKDLIEKWCTQFSDINLIHQVDDAGRSPLHHAAAAGQFDTVKWLFAKGAKLIATDHYGNTPLHLAALHNQPMVVGVLCEKIAQVQAAHQASSQNQWRIVKKLNQFLRYIWSSESLSNINARSQAGETAFTLAEQNNHTKVMGILKSYRAKEAKVVDLFRKGIYHAPKKAHTEQQLQVKLEKRQFQIGSIASHQRELITTTADEAGNNLMHWCVMGMQYRMMHILLHALSLDERKKLCTTKNKAELTPVDLSYQLIEACQAKLNATQDKNERNHIQQQIDKLEKGLRLLLRYDLATYEKKFNSVAIKTSYQYRWNQDIKDEITNTSWYQHAATTSLLWRPCWVFCSLVSANWWLAMEAAAQSYFGSDYLDKLERSVPLATPYVPGFMQGALSYVRSGLWWLGFYRHTAMRIAVEGVSRLATYPLSKFQPKLSANYLTHINWLGLGLLISEEVLGRYAVGSLADTYFGSIEMKLQKTFGIQSLSELAENAGESVNSRLKQLKGVDLKESIQSGYAYAREHWGGVHPPARIFREQVEPSFMENIEVKGEKVRDYIRHLGEALYVKYFNHDELTSKLQMFIDYVNQGLRSEATMSLLDEVCTLSVPENDYGLCVATIATANAFFQNPYFDDEIINKIKKQISSEIHALSLKKRTGNFAALTEILNRANDQAIQIYAERFVDQTFIPATGMEVGEIPSIVREGVIAYITKHAKENKNLNTTLQEMALYLATDKMTDNAIEAFDDIASVLSEQEKDYGEVLVTLLASSPFYQNPELKEVLPGFKTEFSELANRMRTGMFPPEIRKEFNKKRVEDIKKIDKKKEEELASVNWKERAKTRDKTASKDGDFIVNALKEVELSKLKSGSQGDLIAYLLKINSENKDYQLSDALKYAEYITGALKDLDESIIFNKNRHSLYAFLFNYALQREIAENNNQHASKHANLPDYLGVMGYSGSHVGAIRSLLTQMNIRMQDQYARHVVDKFVMPHVKTQAHYREIIKEGAVIYLKGHLDYSDLSSNLQALVNFENDSVPTNVAFEVMHDVAKDSLNSYTEAMTDLFMSSSFFQDFNFDQTKTNTLKTRVKTKLATQAIGQKADLPHLRETLKEAKLFAIALAVGHMKTGFDVVEEYRHFAASRGMEATKDGRKQYVGEQIIAENRLYFNRHHLQGSNYISFFVEYIGETQGNKKRKQARRAADNYETTRTFFIVDELVKPFMADEPLPENIRAILANRDAKEVRAAFAVHQIQVFLEDNTGYWPMDVKAQFDLYRNLINVQHDTTNHDREERLIKRDIYDRLKVQAKEQNNLPLFYDKYTIDNVADHIKDTSKRAGENHWAGTADALTRPIHERERNIFKRGVNFVKKWADRADRLVRGNVDSPIPTLGIGANMNGRGLEIGIMNLNDGMMTGASYKAERAKPKEVFTLQSSSTPSSREYKFDLAEAQRAQDIAHRAIATHPTQRTSSSIVEKSWQQVVAKQFSQDIGTRAFTKAFEHQAEKSKSTTTKLKQAKSAPPVPREVVRTQPKKLAEIPKQSMQKPVVDLFESELGMPLPETIEDNVVSTSTPTPKSNRIAAAVIGLLEKMVPTANASTSSKVPDKKSNPSWLSMAWRALTGEKSEQVLAWKQENRDREPTLAKFNDAFQQGYEELNRPIRTLKENVGAALEKRIEGVVQELEKDKLHPLERGLLHTQKVGYHAAGIAAEVVLPETLGEVGLTAVASVAAGGTAIAKGAKSIHYAYKDYKHAKPIKKLPSNNRIQHEALKTEYKQKMLEPHVKDPKLAKIVKQLYRERASVGSGSTADGARYDIATRKNIKGQNHVQKTADSISFLKRWLKKNPTASTNDRAVAQNLLDDMKDALGEREWYSQTKPPKS
ncbi:MAG: ankyrin repeat domain-containing protein [Candidatus Berkiellales bacterium]